MVYGRTLGERTLEFEASGALKSASLVMRDRQTDSWWSIMSSDAIGGPLEGSELRELPVGEKTTWREWRDRHPDTLVLSVDGAEHVENNPYDNYISSGQTFRGLKVSDGRLPAKAPVYSFWLQGMPWAVPHEAFEGGRVFTVGTEKKRLLLFRPRRASVYESTEAWLVEEAAARRAASAGRLVERIRAGEVVGEPLAGFDTFWYTWVAVNRNTRLLR